MSDTDDFYERAPQELRNVVLEAIDEHQEKKTVELESYLLAIWTNCLPMSESDPPWHRLAETVATAFELEPMPVPFGWRERKVAPELNDDSGWNEFEETLLVQVADLRRMSGGVLEDNHRYLGVQAPSGSPWYNFDPVSFIECGLAGMSATIDQFTFKSNWGGFKLFLECGQSYE
ncbi:MAG: hypothetical protein AAGM16_10315 [Pseudomonadota bacterium]